MWEPREMKLALPDLVRTQIPNGTYTNHTRCFPPTLQKPPCGFGNSSVSVVSVGMPFFSLPSAVVCSDVHDVPLL